MATTNHHRSITQAAWRLALGGALALGVLACVLEREDQVDVQEWRKSRGPVVPHDSFPGDCFLCHTGQGWGDIREDFRFDHLAETGVALEGAHAQAECLRCHNDRGPVQLFAQRGCAGCHEDEHQGQLGHDCQSCHDQRNWRALEQIAKHNQTRFPLIGSHAATACWRCHPNAQAGNFARADTDCITCHAADLARTTSPDHQAQGWVSDCDRCHIPTTWTGGGFNHSTWPLTGAHKTQPCSACHIGGVYAGTPNQCVDCHLDDYNNTNSPNHAALGISTNCAQCHNTSSWFGANFNHTGITNGCVNCHLGDYQNTTNPIHSAAGFPTTCEDCHDTVDWHNAVFNHSFPITSGKHNNFSCSQCHLNPTNYQVFSCTHCHDHSQSQMASEHQGVPGYVWLSSACYNCHPNGQG